MTDEEKKKANDAWNNLPREYRFYLTRVLVGIEIQMGNIEVECNCTHKLKHSD